MYMVEKMIDTSGTINKIRFNRVNKPFAVLSSKLNTLNETVNKIRV